MLGRASFAARALPRNANTFKRFASSKSLKETLEAVIPIKQNQLKQLKATHGQTTVGDVKVEHIIGGMRGLKAMLWEASVLDPNEVRPYPILSANTSHRVYVSTDSRSQTVNLSYLPHQEARKSLRRVCSGFSSLEKFLLPNKLAGSRLSLRRRVNYPTLL